MSDVTPGTEPSSDDWRTASAITLLRTQGAWAAADAVAKLEAKVERLRGLWQDEALITRLFEAHMRGDLTTVLREALDG